MKDEELKRETEESSGTVPVLAAVVCIVYYLEHGLLDSLSADIPQLVDAGHRADLIDLVQEDDTCNTTAAHIRPPTERSQRRQRQQVTHAQRCTADNSPGWPSSISPQWGAALGQEKYTYTHWDEQKTKWYFVRSTRQIIPLNTKIKKFMPN